jgi:hypothetical protein
MTVRPFTPEQRKRAQPVVAFCGSSLGLERLLVERFPHLARAVEEWFNADVVRWCEGGHKALIEAVRTHGPQPRELFDRALSKKLRERLLRAVANAYDDNFMRAGGRTRNTVEAHEYALARARGTPWDVVSTKGGTVHADRDKARKMVERDREPLIVMYLILVEVAGPQSNASAQVKAEFASFEETIRQPSLKKGTSDVSVA